jgi:glutamate-5-semialdehyde dehydrogenase
MMAQRRTIVIKDIATLAKSASVATAALSSEVKRTALGNIAQALLDHQDEIIAANESDLVQARKDNLATALLKRLKFDADKIKEAAAGINSLIKLPDPVGKTLKCTELDTGLELFQVTCPIGVLGIIFESRPDALVQISALALTSGNCVLLKGGSEAMHTNRILFDIIYQASIDSGIPRNWMGLIETRDDVKEMLSLDDCIDLIIPRGGNAFVQYIMQNSNIMVLGHADGICHVYIDCDANIDMAVDVAFDSKCQYAAVCNAMETLLVHEQIANAVLPKLKDVYTKAGVTLVGCEKSRKVIDINAASEADWQTEYNDLTLSIKIVTDVDDAITHVNHYGSSHTDAIVTGNQATAATFLNLCDTANAYWNCSTRYADGFRYGLGAEVGVSTNKIHARGPVGLEGLVSYKYIMIGNGQVVSDYSGDDGKAYTHKVLDKDCPL